MMYTVVRLPQHTETGITNVIRPSWRYQYGYSRSTEARTLGDIGQDYLTVAESRDAIVFAVCDGISMSYFGDYAARFLGEGLKEWLTGLEPSSGEAVQADEWTERLHKQLVLMAEQARAELEEHQIPSHITGMLREVLLSKKQLGSGAVYACGRLDRPSETLPEGRILLAWQGDIRIRLWMENEECKGCLGDRFHTREQWNSSVGPVAGKPHVYTDGLAAWGSAGRLILYTDGLQRLDSIDPLRDEDIDAAMRQEAANPSSDDQSIFQLYWQLATGAIRIHDSI